MKRFQIIDSLMDPIPGESGYGYLCRIMHLMGHGHISTLHTHTLGIHWPDGLRIQKLFHFASLLRVLRMRSDLSPEVVATKYSNFGLFRLFVDWDFTSDFSSFEIGLRDPRIYESQNKEIESSQAWSAPSWWSPLGVSAKRLFYCRDCVRDQLAAYGFATWMSMHNSIETKICHVHIKPLFSSKPHIGILPSSCTLKDSEKIEVKDDELVEELRLSRFLVNLMNSSLPMISSKFTADILKRNISRRWHRLTNLQRSFIEASYLGHDCDFPEYRLRRSYAKFRADLMAAATVFDSFCEFERTYLRIAKYPELHSDVLSVRFNDEDH